MSQADMFDSHPSGTDLDAPLYLDALDALEAAARAATQCADACVAERDPARLRDCIAAAQDVADLCAATARVIARQTEADPVVHAASLRACIEACHRCADACDRHGGQFDHCRICADACNDAVAACRALHRELDGLEEGVAEAATRAPR